MLNKIKNKFKNKKGAMLTIIVILIIPICLLVAMLCDIGRYYIYKIEMQKMADAITTGVAQSAVEGYRNSYEGAKYDIVLNQNTAKNKAKELYNLNDSDLSKELTNKNISYNFDTTVRDISSIGAKYQDALYKAGVFHVEFSADFKCFLSTFTGVDSIKILVDSTSQVRPSNKSGFFAKENASNVVKTEVNDDYIKIYDSKGRLYYSKSH